MSLWSDSAEPWFTSAREQAAGSSAQHARSRRSRRRKKGWRGSGVLRLLRQELELVGHSAELGKRTGVHFPHRPAAVHLDRGFGDADIAGNLFAQATARDLNHDFALPGA